MNNNSTSPMRNNPKQHPPANNNLQVGLRIVVHSEAKLPPTYHPRIVHCYTMATTSKSSSPPSSLSSSSSMFQLSVIDDLIGTESGDCMSSDADQELMAKTQTTQSNLMNKARRCSSTMRRQYPPSIPLLVQTGTLRGRMPWLFKREYSCDGRLIIRAERMRHHEYLETHKENGRLRMKLVSLDLNTVWCDEEEREEVEELSAEEEEGGGFDSKVEELVNDGSNLWKKSCLENNTEPCEANGNLGRTSWAPFQINTTVK